MSRKFKDIIKKRRIKKIKENFIFGVYNFCKNRKDLINIIVSIIFLINFCFPHLSQLNAQNQNWLTGFSYRKAITIDNTSNSSNLTDYQVLLTFDTQTLISQGKMRSDCGDIRFTDSNGTTLLNYWIESGCNTTQTKVWIKVPSIPASSNKTIYVYYGNSNATSASNGDATFIFFDDFSIFDTNKWSYSGSPSVSNGVLSLPAVSFVTSKNSFLSLGTLIEATIKVDSEYRVRVGFYSKPLNYDIPNSVYNEWALGSCYYNGLDPTVNIWQNWKVIYTYSSSFGYLDNNFLLSCNEIPNSPDNVYIRHWAYGTTQIDRIISRKYTSPEPTTSLYAEQSNYQYSYRKAITIDNTSNSSNLYNYQVLLTFDTQTLISQGKLQSNCQDLRFTDDSQNWNENQWLISYPYWIESGCNTTQTKVWIKVPSISASSQKTIYLYYGNSSASSLSNGDNTFEKFITNIGDTDTNVKSVYYPNQNYINDNRWLTGGWGDTYWGLLKIPFSVIPSYVTPTNIASVYLYSYSWFFNNNSSVYSQGYYLQYITSDWSPSTVTWNSRPSLGSSFYSYGPVSINANASTPAQWYQSNVTSWAQDTTYGLFGSNYGIAVTPFYTSYGTWFTAHSLNNTNRWYLIISFSNYNFKVKVESLTSNFIWISRKYTSPEPTTSLYAEQSNYQYSYRKAITIDNTSNSSNLYNYQVLLTFDTQTLISQGKLQSNCQDLRFTDDSQNWNENQWLISYPYWIESGCNTTQTKVWIKVPSISASSQKTIYLYYGNSSASSLSNGDNTFEKFITNIGDTDTNVKSVYYPNQNYINDNRWLTGGWGDTYWGLLKIPFSVIPSYVTPTNIASVYLYSYSWFFNNNSSVYSQGYYLQYITSDWSPSTVTWNSRPSLGSSFYSYGPVSINANASTPAQWYQSNVTSWAQDTTYGLFGSNYGIAVTPFYTSYGTWFTAHSLNNTNRWYLIISFSNYNFKVKVESLTSNFIWISRKYTSPEPTTSCGEEFPSNRAPVINSVVLDPNPVQAGIQLEFRVSWEEPDGDQTKLHVCKTDSIEGQTCANGAWCETSDWSTSSPSICYYQTTSSDVGQYNYYAFICDDKDKCSNSTGTFEVIQNQVPQITSADISSTSTWVGVPVKFTVEWSDPGDLTKIHICRTNAINEGICSGGSYCDSSEWSTSSPSECFYTPLRSDIGSHNYYAFVCDSIGQCSSYIQGIFEVFEVNEKGYITLATTTSSGFLISSILDSGVLQGVNFNSLIWQGTLCSGCQVKIQLASSNSPSGPWNYYGPLSQDDYYTPLPGEPVTLPFSGSSAHQNKRYIRYKIELIPSNGQSPVVESISINYSK